MRELFSRRNRDRSQDPEVYTYLDFSKAFRNQSCHIIEDIILAVKEVDPYYQFTYEICSLYSREKGLKCLRSEYGKENTMGALEYYLDKCENEDFLDFIDYTFGLFENSFYKEKFGRTYRKSLSNGIDELNHRFRQHSLGYEFINGEIIQKTNEVAHEQIIKPALKMLNDVRFQGAEDEFMTAFDHLKSGNNKDAILNAGKAFESTMKVICSELQYPFDSQKDTAKILVQTLKQNSFFPKYLESYMNNICSLLSEGAPVVRNKESGHGQGEAVKNAGDEFVEYVLNTVASNIVFLYRLFRSKEGVK